MPVVICETMFILLIASSVFSQQPTWITIHPVELGLNSNAVTALYEDRDAHLWIGTAGGDVAVFEGSNWKVVLPGSGSHSGYISKITSDKRGTIWSINAGSLWRYADNIWKRYEGSVTSVTSKVVARVGESDCWDKQIVGVEPEVFEGIPFISGDTIDLEFDEVNTLWVVSESEKMVFSFDGEHISCWDEVSTKKVLYHTPFQVLPLSRGRVLVVEIDFPIPIWLYDREQWSLLPEPPPSLGTKLVSNSAGEFFGGARDGLYRFAAGKWEKIATWSVDEIESCSAIALDDSGGIWAVVKKRDYTASLFYSQEGRVTQVSYPHNIPEEDRTSVVLLAVTPEQKLIIGDREGLHIQSNSSTSVKAQSWGELKNNQ